MKILVVLCLTVAASISSIASEVEPSKKADYVAVLRETLMVLGRQEGAITAFIPPVDANPDLIAALKALGNVVPRAAVPRSKKFTLPKGYLIVENIHLKNGMGNFRGIAGPGALKGTLGKDEDCGAHYSISFWFKDGKWENGPYSKQDCSVD